MCVVDNVLDCRWKSDQFRVALLAQNVDAPLELVALHIESVAVVAIHLLIYDWQTKFVSF